MQVDGVLTEAEASRFVQTAETIGLKHQGSKGSAYGEVPAQPELQTAVWIISRKLSKSATQPSSSNGVL